MTMVKFALALGVMCLLIPVEMSAQQVKSPVVGVLVSGSRISNGTVIGEVATGKVLVLTQLCCSSGSPNTNCQFFYGLAGGNGQDNAIVQLSPFYNTSIPNISTVCQNFEPGFVVPAGSKVVCAGGTPTNFTCSAVGIVTPQTL
jgi:hypothetical protein